MVTEDYKTSDKYEAEEQQRNECNEEVRHGGSKGGGVARVVSDDEASDDGHADSMSVGASRALLNDCVWCRGMAMSVTEGFSSTGCKAGVSCSPTFFVDHGTGYRPLTWGKLPKVYNGLTLERRGLRSEQLKE